MSEVHDVEVRELVNLAGQTHYKAWCKTCECWVTNIPGFYSHNRSTVERQAQVHISRMNAEGKHD